MYELLMTMVLIGATPAPPGELPAPTYPPGVVDVTPTTLPPSTGACPAPAAEQLPRFLVSVDYLLIRPRRRDLEFASADASNNLNPEGETASLDWATRSGFRAGLLWRPEGGRGDVAFTYTYANSRDDRTVNAPAGGLLYAELARPGRIDEVQSATGATSFHFNQFDLDFGRYLAGDECWMARGFVGVRFANIRQELTAYYDGLDANKAQTSEKLKMTGAGLTAGGEASWQLFGGVCAYGRGRGSLIAGDFQLNHRQTDFDGNVVLADINDEFTKIVPVFDLGAGLSYRYRNWSASFGYELSHWFNQVEGIAFVDDFAEGKRIRKQSDLSLEAIVFRFGVEY